MSLKWFLGWLSVRHTRASVLHTRGIKGDLNHDRLNSDGYHDGNHTSNRRYGHDYDVRYDRKTLLNLIERMGASRYRFPKDNVQYSMASSVNVHIVNGRALGMPCYNGRFHRITKYSDHFTKSTGLRPF